MTDQPARPLPDGSDVRPLRSEEIPRAASVLARAFEDDPFWTWVYRGDPSRAERFRRGMIGFLRHIYLPSGGALALEHLTGFALWEPPGAWKVSLRQQLRVTPATFRGAGPHVFRLLRTAFFVERQHPREPHWYLAFLGVEPEWQGRGFGAALLAPVLKECDERGLAAHLEASSPRNRAFYERHGFVARRELRLGESPPLWQMWREPGGA